MSISCLLFCQNKICPAWGRFPDLLQLYFGKKMCELLPCPSKMLLLVFAGELAPAFCMNGCHRLWSTVAQSFHLQGPICLPEMKEIDSLILTCLLFVVFVINHINFFDCCFEAGLLCFIFQAYFKVNPFVHNVVKWPNILQKSCGVNTGVSTRGSNKKWSWRWSFIQYSPF